MADEKFITTVEQRLTAVDETQEAFDSAIKRQQDLAKAHEDVAKSTEKQNENYKHTKDLLDGIKEGIQEEINALNIRGKLWQAAKDHVAEYVRQLKESLTVQANNDAFIFLHSLSNGYSEVIAKVREYREETIEAMKSARVEMLETKKIWQLQKDSIKEQLELEKELIEARKNYNIALAGGDPQKKKEAEAKAREETDAAKEKAEGNRLGIVFAQSTQAQEKASEFRKEEKEWNDQADKASASLRSFREGKTLESSVARKNELANILSDLNARRNMFGGGMVGPSNEDVQVDPLTGKASRFVVDNNFLNPKTLDTQIKELEEKIRDEDEVETRAKNYLEIAPSKISNLRSRASRAQGSAIQFESLAERGFEEVESGKKRAGQRTGTRNEIRSLQLATEEITAQNKQDTENQKTAKTIINDIPDEPQSDASKWVRAASILSRENAELKSLLGSILEDKSASIDDMNAFKKKLKDVDRRLVNP